jgi:AraC-like DNA-binding protein/mannose-6-phosphate isomerase-like protein (cupin superfamily)
MRVLYPELTQTDLRLEERKRVTWPVERYSASSLVVSDAGVRVMRPELSDVDVHWHDYYELSLVTAGEAEHVVNGQVRSLTPGQAFLLSPADFHELRVRRGESLECYNVVLEPGLVERHLASLTTPSGGFDLPWHTDDFADAAPELRRLQRELEEPRLGSRVAVDALVAGLVVELARRCVAPRAEPAPLVDDPDLHAAVLMVDRHFREPLRLADCAARAHLSPNYFSERFRAYTGTSFQVYLQERRLRFAQSLLTATTLSVTEVCHAAGFNSLSHFGRAYRRRFGASPSAATRRPASVTGG